MTPESRIIAGLIACAILGAWAAIVMTINALERADASLRYQDRTRSYWAAMRKMERAKTH